MEPEVDADPNAWPELNKFWVFAFCWDRVYTSEEVKKRQLTAHYEGTLR